MPLTQIDPRTPQACVQQENFSAYFTKDDALKVCHRNCVLSAGRLHMINERGVSSKKEPATSLHELMIPTTSRIELKLCSQNDETYLTPSEDHFDFAESVCKIKESERFMVLVQSSINSTDEAFEQKKLNCQMDPVLATETLKIPDDNSFRRRSVDSIYLDESLNLDAEQPRT